MKKALTVLLSALIGWAWCGALMGIGMAILPIDIALIVHAIGGPLGFAILAAIYFKKYHYTSPLVTAAIFIGLVIFLDFFLVALIINDSLDMFRSFLGTWLPFILIFAVTFLVGFCRNR